MALVHHRIMTDGSIFHDPFTQAGWESAMHDPTVDRHWGHAPGDCHDPVAKLWAGLRRGGRQLNKSQHVWADLHDPTWAGPREVEEKIVVSVEEPIVWPPTTTLTPWMLCQMTSLCMDDARRILFRLVEKVEPVERKPSSNRTGQYSLF